MRVFIKNKFTTFRYLFVGIMTVICIAVAGFGIYYAIECSKNLAFGNTASVIADVLICLICFAGCIGLLFVINIDAPVFFYDRKSHCLCRKGRFFGFRRMVEISNIKKVISVKRNIVITVKYPRTITSHYIVFIDGECLMDCGRSKNRFIIVNDCDANREIIENFWFEEIEFMDEDSYFEMQRAMYNMKSFS